jgi:micrococcal nuclease
MGLRVLLLLVGLSSSPPLGDNFYHYRCNVVSVYDGDTVTADIDLGMGVWLHGAKLRLYGINAPELRGPEKVAGKRSRDFLKRLLDGKRIVLETIEDKTGKYGRWLAVLWVKGQGDWCPSDRWCNVNEALVANGQAKEARY